MLAAKRFLVYLFARRVPKNELDWSNNYNFTKKGKLEIILKLQKLISQEVEPEFKFEY